MNDQSRLAIGVLDDHHLWIVNPERTAVQQYHDVDPIGRTFGDLFDICKRMHFSQLWIHQSWAQAAGMWHPAVMDKPFICEASSMWQCTPDMRVMSPYYRGYRPGMHGTYTIMLPWLDDSRATWKECADGAQLAQALMAYSAALGFDYRLSPGGTGTALIRQLHSTSTRQTPLEVPDLPYVAKTNVARDVAWIDASAIPSPAPKYIYALDKNAMYVGACASLDLGMGHPVHVSFEEYGDEGMLISQYPMETLKLPLPGYYCVRNYFADKWHPAPVETLFDPDGFYAKHPSASLWVTAPIIKAALEHDYDLRISEMYYWPEKHQALQSWYRRIRDARNGLWDSLNQETVKDIHPVAPFEIALQNLKRTYTQAIGWLDGSWLREEGSDPLYRPDWRHHIVAEAHARMWRQFDFARLQLPVFAWDVDCFYVLSDLGSGAEVLELAGLPAGTGVGRYKVKGTYLFADYESIIHGAESATPRMRTTALHAMLRKMSEEGPTPTLQEAMTDAAG